MTQLPDRSTIGGGGDVTKAAAEIFTKVKQDNLAAEARLRRKEKEKPEWAAARGITLSPSPVPMVQPTVEIHESELGPLNEQTSTGEGGAGHEDQEASQASQTEERGTRKSPRTTAQKRSRDDKEAEALADKERKQRDARLRRERSAEAEKRRDKKRAAAEAAKVETARQQLLIQNLEESLQEEERKRKQLQKEKADRELLEAHQQISEQYERERQEYQAAKAVEEAAAKAAQEEAAKAAMPPPPPPPAVTLTPARATILTDAGTNRPGSARSFVEEDNVFHDAGVQTPTPPSPKGARRPGPPPPPPPPQPAQPAIVKPTSPPSVLKQPPRRPGGTPASRKVAPGHPRTANQQESGQGEPTMSDQPQQSSPSDHRTTTSYAARLRSRFKPVPGSRTGAEEEQPDTRTSPSLAAHGPPQLGVRSGTWSVLKIIASAFLMLHFIRVFNVVIRPDLFETPVMSIKWHGWNNMSSWANNVGQFFPSPLLHPLGVLTNDQYDDLKDYLQRRTATTEATVNDLKSILPKVVSVRKDKKGKIIIADELWNALKDRIDHDSSILSLDKKSRISDEHWQAVSKRLEDAGLLRKPLSASDVEKIVDKSAPVSWEKWLKNNKRLVADIIGQPKGAPKGSGEAVVSKDEFIGELKQRLAESKKGIDAELDVLRKEFRGLIPEVKKIASSSGMTKADTAALIKQVVDKEITRRIAGIGSGGGGSSAAPIDAMFRRQVNHFSPGNGALIDISWTSPIYKIDRALIGSKEWVKKRNEPHFMQEASQALTAWTDPGHCWCAGTLGDDNSTLPAFLGVRLPQFIIPQTVILEHIAPSATTDRGATPKDVEVWAMFDEHARRERALDWMGAQYPGSVGAKSSKQEQRLVQNGFAKIGQFRYEHRPRDEGMFVHALSRDLVDRLRAATDLVVIRAVTNYGAKDHN
jgi:hypothetical protein